MVGLQLSRHSGLHSCTKDMKEASYVTERNRGPQREPERDYSKVGWMRGQAGNVNMFGSAQRSGPRSTNRGLGLKCTHVGPACMPC